ncbi:MAG: vitamin K epoxide reductase family protein [Vicinamibacterales bacterium]
MAVLPPAATPPADPPAVDLRWMGLFVLAGLAASGYATWVHHQVITDPAYAAVCDVSANVSCTNAYTSAYGTFAGISVALLGAVYFTGLLLLLGFGAALPRLGGNIAGYVFAASIVGLAGVFYLGYASFVVLKNVCLVCVATYVAVIGLFVSAAVATRIPMRTLPARLAADLATLLRTPAAAAAALAFAALAVGAIRWFPAEAVSAASAPADAGQAAAAATPALPADALRELEQFLAGQQRVPVMVPTEGAAVVLVKFNDYMCPPCGQTFAMYKPVLAKYAREYPGKLKFVTKDYPLDPECNRLAPGGAHMASCEAAVAVRLAREKGKADAMEDWLFANQPTLTPVRVKEAARMVGGVPDFEARYATVLQLVKGDIEQGGQLQVQGTPTFFLNGIRLPGLRPEFLDAAIALELKRAGVAVK